MKLFSVLIKFTRKHSGKQITTFYNLNQETNSDYIPITEDEEWAKDRMRWLKKTGDYDYVSVVTFTESTTKFRRKVTA